MEELFTVKHITANCSLFREQKSEKNKSSISTHGRCSVDTSLPDNKWHR
jgi:hypothetical protein